MTVVKHEDFKSLNYCNRGGRKLAERYGLNWGEFVRNGVDASVFAKIDDEMVRALIQAAIRREENERK